ncbi:MAG: adenylate/guanylate cyclase domain-containing protein [Gemmatimonadetes bacterium]|nr:adenylate/guanylate cyclase domain-containing protein [Gemmatimonadota bacterium]
MDSTRRLLDITGIFRAGGPPRPRRTRATIMFADLAGYSALMQADEAAALEARAHYRRTLTEAVDKAGGVIIQHYGDGSLTIFRSPRAGTEAALEIQRRLSEIGGVPLRIGLHLDEVVRDDEGVYGHGVNVAARVQSLCPPGAVLASDALVNALPPESASAHLPGRDSGAQPAVRCMGTFQLRNMDHLHDIYCIAPTLKGMPDPTSLRSTSAVMVAPPATQGGRQGLWSSLMWEIKRRGVHRALRSYTGLAATLSAGAFLLSASGPNPTLLGACAVAGFPVTAAFSWFFDLSPNWIRVTPPRTETRGARSSHRPEAAWR